MAAMPPREGIEKEAPPTFKIAISATRSTILISSEKRGSSRRRFAMHQL
jgi:hypothetical protein